MLEKLENFMGFIFKMTKWIIMLLFIVFVVILFRSCSSTMDIMDEATSKYSTSQSIEKGSKTNSQNIKTFDCKIEAWKFQKTSSNYITVDGTTTCNNGKLVLKIYDGDSKDYIGNDTTYINNGTFKSLIRTSVNPNSLEVKFTIIER
jgi:ABC-type transport system involved in Fe-S cluster assembly fused permease/ATPase subunit